MSGLRAQAKRRLMANRHHIYLAGGIGRVRRGSIITLAMSWNGQEWPLGWIKADRCDPTVNMGRRPS